MSFKLFPEEARWWSFQDYAAVLKVMAELQPRRVVEFGPGNSTLSLIEGGADHIDAFEDKLDWYKVWDERIVKKFAPKVDQWLYEWANPLMTVLDDRRWDMALIDGPFTTPRRPPVIEWCINHCDAVLLPLEEYQQTRPYLRPVVEALAKKYGMNLHTWETGPHSGSFALLT